jgi:hypothetical protein
MASFALGVIGTLAAVASAFFGYLTVAPIVRRGREENAAPAPPSTLADDAPTVVGKIIARDMGNNYTDVAGVRQPAEHAITGTTLYLGPLVLCVPLVILALAGVKQLETYTPWWIILASSLIGLLATATEYSKNRIHALILEVNFMWLTFYSFFFVEVASHMTYQSYIPYFTVLFTAATLVNFALLVLTSFLKARYHEQSIHPLLIVFLGFLTAGFFLEMIADIDTSNSQGRLGALLTFVAVFVNARALLLAVMRKAKHIER